MLQLDAHFRKLILASKVKPKLKAMRIISKSKCSKVNIKAFKDRDNRITGLRELTIILEMTWKKEIILKDYLL